MGAIKILSSKGWFTIEEYNDALSRHKFKSYETADKPTSIKNPKAKKLQGKAVSIWTHMRSFGMIVEQFVKDMNDEVLDLALQLSEITERLAAHEFREFEIEILEERIIHYLECRRKVYEDFPDLLGTPKPKHHYLCHYPDAIRKFGPPMCFWTGRYESKHRIAKGTTESAKNFVNITSTLAIRQQMRLASKYYSGFCETAVVHMPGAAAVTTKEDLKETSEVNVKLKQFMGKSDEVCNKIVINGQEYKIGDVVVTKASDRDTLEVGVVQEILCWKLFVLGMNLTHYKKFLCTV